MPYDEFLAERIRNILARYPGVIEKRMFGGVAFMLQGNLACGVNGPDLIVRVGQEKNEAALSRLHTRPFAMTGRPMSGWILVTPAGWEKDDELENWVKQGVEYALSLPAK